MLFLILIGTQNIGAYTQKSQAEKQAEQFVLNVWKNHYTTPFALNLEPTSQRFALVKEYFYAQCTCSKGKSPFLRNTCSFTLTDVYRACYDMDRLVDQIQATDTSELRDPS